MKSIHPPAWSATETPPRAALRDRLRAFFHGAARAMEAMSGTRVNSQLGLVLDVAVALALLGASVHLAPAPIPAALLFGAGLVVFSFIEYAFHRWLFHGSLAAFERGHDKHHQRPLGYDSLPFFVAPTIVFGIALALAAIFPGRFALTFAAALASGYAVYGLSHWIIHAHRFRHPLARRWAAAHHVHHHHTQANFGVTSPLWDIVFGTRHVSRGIRSA